MLVWSGAPARADIDSTITASRKKGAKSLSKIDLNNLFPYYLHNFVFIASYMCCWASYTRWTVDAQWNHPATNKVVLIVRRLYSCTGRGPENSESEKSQIRCARKLCGVSQWQYLRVHTHNNRDYVSHNLKIRNCTNDCAKWRERRRRKKWHVAIAISDGAREPRTSQVTIFLNWF